METEIKKPRLNLYTCTKVFVNREGNVSHSGGCGQTLVTRDDDEGVTPYALRCNKCGGFMYSSFYQPPPLVSEGIMPVEAIWKKPNAEEYKTLSKGEREHVDKGGLLLYNLIGERRQ